MSFDTLTVRIPNALKDLLEHVVHERLEAVERTVDHLVRHMQRALVFYAVPRTILRSTIKHGCFSATWHH